MSEAGIAAGFNPEDEEVIVVDKPTDGSADGVTATRSDAPQEGAAASEQGQASLAFDALTNDSDPTQTDESLTEDGQPQTEAEFLVQVGETKDSLLQQEGALSIIFQNIEKNITDADVLIDLYVDFDEVYQKSKESVKKLGFGVNKFGSDAKNLQGNEVFQRIDEILEIDQRIEQIRQKKDLLSLIGSELKDAVGAKTIEGAKNAIDKFVVDGEIDSAKAELVKKDLEAALNFTSLSINALIDLNKGSSIDTFLSFLIDPVGTRGREGLSFGTSEFDGFAHERVPLPLFRDLFSEPKKVALALQRSAKLINESWASQNQTQIDALKDFKEGDEESLKSTLLLLFKELFIESDESEKNKKNFKIHFAGAIMNEGDKKFCLDDRSMLFFAEQMQNNAANLKTLWNIPS